MSRTLEKLNEGFAGAELVFEEEDILAEESELDALSAMLKEIEQQAQLSLIEHSGEFTDLTVSDMLIAILSRFDKQKKLSEISVSELVSLFLDLQSPKS
jgi:hypothetical protein